MIEYSQTIVSRFGEYLSPARWARRSLVGWLPGILRTLSVLCILHCGLAAASGSAQTSRFDGAIAEGKKLRDAGRLEEALRAFQRANTVAQAIGDVDRQASALIFSSACDIRLFRYRAAIESAETGSQLALRVHDQTRAGIAAVNIALTYRLLGDFALAERKQREAVRLLTGSSRQDALAQALFSYAFIEMSSGKTLDGKHSSDQAIAVARNANLPSIEAVAWDSRGTSLLLSGNIPEAEQALNHAYSIRERLHDTDGLSQTLEHRAELELKKCEYELALKDIDQAFASAGPVFKGSPQYYPIHVRAQILLGLGRKSDALAEFHRAVEAATTWRRSAMPGDASSIETVAFLHDVYQDYAELAAELALERHEPELSRRAFEALAENRAASLREQLTLVLSQNSSLPPRYFELLSEFQSAQARVTLGESSAVNEEKLQQIRLELSDLEDQIGIKGKNLSPAKEKNALQNSLRNIQLRLGKSDVLLSFCLGKKKSFLWTITGDEVNLYPLPAESQIASQAKTFSDSVQSGQNAPSAALSLSRNLFGKLTPAVWQKRDWLITADGALLSGMPFAALPDLTSPDSNQPLIANHTLRSLPSELLLLSSDTAKPEKRFVGVADPIYNLADSRRARNVTLLQTANGTPALGRLAGSDREIKNAAKQSGMPEVELLVGSHASSEALRNALAETPEVLHFAVHVVSPRGEPQQAALALSLTKENMPELLTREAIAAYRIPGSLVVMSGCSSEQGRAVPSAGLIGLSRAWLLAGAAAVVVSAWPTPDDSGEFFSVFYSYLQASKSGSLSSRAAAALEQTQLQMRRSTGSRDLPSFWAAYSIVSKE